MALLTLETLEPLAGRVVFYRPDYNVPVKDGVIQDQFRITATYPTLDKLVSAGAKVVIGAHMGRPKGEDPALSLEPVAQVLADRYPKQAVNVTSKIDDPAVHQAIAEMQNGDILVLPNLRYSPAEEANDTAYASQLASLAELYVNDAFACDHRAHASIVGIPAKLPHAAGYLLQEEVETLGSLLEAPESPFVVVMGGAKVSDKIEVIRRLAAKADKVLIGGAMANTFLLAKGEPIGDSLAEPDKVDVARGLLEEFGDKLVVAIDFVKDNPADTEHFRYLDIGSESVELFAKELSTAKTIFSNGSVGYTEDEKFAVGSIAVAKAIAARTGKATTVVAGGDTVELISRLKMHDKFSFVSTGGGAALEFLAGAELPGVKALES
jgi:phosphoglycerate kinase